MTPSDVLFELRGSYDYGSLSHLTVLQTVKSICKEFGLHRPYWWYTSRNIYLDSNPDEDVIELNLGGF